MKYTVTVTKPNGDVRQVVKTKTGFTTILKNAKYFRFNRVGVRRIKKWAERKKFKVRYSKTTYPFIILDTDTKMPRRALARKINTLGRRMRRYIWIGEGWRTNARQWQLWREYLARGRRPPLVAYPGTSRHESGWAADTSVFLHGLNSGYTNVGLVDQCRKIMRQLGLGLTVPGEPWHVEISNQFLA